MSKPAPIRSVTTFRYLREDLCRVTYASGKTALYEAGNVPPNAAAFIASATHQTTRLAFDGVEELTYTKEA